MTLHERAHRRRDILKGAGAGAIVLAFDLPLGGCKDGSGAAELPETLARFPHLESWIRIGQNGRVALFTGKAELGQGILTACVQIAADELDVSPDRIDIVSADTGATPDEGFTFGSLSIQQSGMAIRQAAAELRHLLVTRAAERLGVDRAAIRISDGEMRGGGQNLTYWQLAEKDPFRARATGHAEPKAPEQRRYRTAGLERVDIPDKVFGRARFVQDLRLPGMLHGRVVRPSSYAAWLRRLDDAAARSMPGVVAVVRDGSFLGVVAEREEQAIAAAAALREAAEWAGGSALPAQDGIAAYILGHPVAAVTDITPADAAAPSGKSEHDTTLAARYFRPFQAHAAMGPAAAVARMAADGLTVWSHTQGVYPLRATLAQVLDMEPARIRVIHKEGAGCYGHNAADDAALDAALLARAVGDRPVRVQWMRQDEFRWEPFGSAMVMEAAARISPDGRIRAWHYDVRGFPHSSRPGGGRAGNLIAARHLANPFDRPAAFNIPQPTGGLDRNAIPLYELPIGHIREHLIAESPLRVSALRGLGAYANIFAIESFVDEISLAVRQDPVDFRLAHLADARARAVVERAAERARWRDAGPRRGDRGRGFAFARYKNLGGYLAVVAFVRVDRETGRIRIERAVAAADCGEVINADGVRNQIEGGLLQSASWTLFESVRFGESKITSEDWSGYPILDISDTPDLEVVLIDRPTAPPLGAGEVAQGPMAAAIGNAVFDAVGLRLRDLPLTPTAVKAALAASSGGE